MINLGKNGRAHVLEMANRASIQKLSNESVSGITGRLDNHESGLNTSAHGINNIAGLSAFVSGVNTDLSTIENSINSMETDISGINSTLLNKVDKPASTYSGTITIVTGVNFTTQSVITKQLSYSNGLLISIT